MFEQIIIKSHRKDYVVDFCPLSEEFVRLLSKDTFLLVDSNVNNLYPAFCQIFDKKRVILIESSENNKTIPYCQKILSELVEANFKKNHKIVAVGGGITQDIVGFVSSVLYRGVDWIFLPTTLLAQADSCIGSKISINLGSCKNLVGTFYPPSHIYCCPEFINTLGVQDIKSGIGEIMHYYLVDGTKSIDSLIASYDDLLKDPTTLTPHIRESLNIKRKVIEKDEFDCGDRLTFNYGHTFGHAIEALTCYEVPHGQAITLGMDIANFVSLQLGYISKDIYDYFYEFLKKNIPKFKLKKEDLNLYLSLISKDKKNTGDSIVCILPYGVGDIRVKKIADKNIMKTCLQKYIEKDYTNELI